jgi:predicted DNA binding CopG/RHH family protein
MPRKIGEVITWRTGWISMEQRLVTPKFENESEEAKWWFDNRDNLLDEFEQAGKEGRLERGMVARRANAAALVALDPEDAARAKTQAERRGLEYQAYVKMVIHEALLHEEQRT